MLSLKHLRLILVAVMVISGLAVSQPAQAAPLLAEATYTYSTSPNRVITDATGSVPSQTVYFTEDILHVADRGTILDVNVTVNIDHDNVFDLGIAIEHGGTTVQLLEQIGDSCDDYDLTFDDGTTPLPTSCSTVAYVGPYPTGTFAPQGNLGDFDGLEVSGPWTLILKDFYPGDAGTLISWSITVRFEVEAIVTGGNWDGPFFFTDGRENKYDIWATSAVYCETYGIDVYAIDADGNGTLAFQVTPEEIAAFGIPPEGATPDQMLVKEGMGLRLYRLPDGPFQVNAPAGDDDNGYVYIWDGCGF